MLAGRKGALALSIEPQHRLTPVIERNLLANELSAEVHQTALSDRLGTAHLNISADTNSGASSIMQDTGETVPTTTLDAFLGLCRIQHIRLLKIDCEGAEQLVIPGAHDTLRNHRVDFLSLEFHPTIIGGEACEAIGRTLATYDYHLSTIDGGLWVYHLPGLEHELKPLGKIARNQWP